MKKFRFGREMAVTFPEWCDTGIERFKGLRHKLTDSGIEWLKSDINQLPYYNHMEMTGLKVSCILSYGADESGLLKINRHLVFPTLRMIPNDTRGNLTHNFNSDLFNKIYVDGIQITEMLESVNIDTYLSLKSTTDLGIGIRRTFIPSMTDSLFIEKVVIENFSNKEKKIEVELNQNAEFTKEEESVNGPYKLEVYLQEEINQRLGPGSTLECHFIYSGDKKLVDFNPEKEISNRAKFIDEIDNYMVIETPDKVLNTACQFTKRRFSESIIETKRGYMHAPGGGDYYAALWTNDQCEYVNPIFPYLGYKIGIDQSMNAYQLFMTYMKDFDTPLISSIVAEGDGYWNGAGDRGDAAMFAYGASRFALALGDKEKALKLWPGIKWCIDYSLKKKNKYGVIMSDSDELENRFESGDANLFTSCLVYDALISANDLAKELNIETEDYVLEADLLKVALETYFGETIKDYHTYQYCDGHKLLRSWICMPLVVGIDKRKMGTIDALLSDHLWTEDGLKTCESSDTFWDRSTLFALRGMFYVGAQDTAIEYLKSFTSRRLLGEHVPYPVEAYPEGNQKHLAGESALYSRIFLEGIIGLRPVGFKKYEIKPNIPGIWPSIKVKNIFLGSQKYTIEITNTDQYNVKILGEEKMIAEHIIDKGDKLIIDLLT